MRLGLLRNEGLLRAEVRVRAMLSCALQARTSTRCAAGSGVTICRQWHEGGRSLGHGALVPWLSPPWHEVPAAAGDEVGAELMVAPG